MARVLFDVAYLYYLTQYLPVYRALVRRGVDAGFVVYDRPRQPGELVREVVGRLGLSATWVASQAEAAAHYRRERPDWVVFGHGFDHLSELPGGTRSAQLHHGIGMKADVYDAGLFDQDVRFTEGPHYTEILAERFPDANLVEVGYAKVDPLFWEDGERPAFDLAGAGLDPGRPTVLYAPTAFPSSFGAMPDHWPDDFRGFNLIVKAHQFSHFSPRHRAHRRKMARWARADNVYVVPAREFDPNPYFAVADLLISDASSVLFEFAAQDRPVVWCDFLKLPLRYRGPWRHRLERRMDRAIDRYADICAHAASYAALKAVVEAELAHPERYSAKRREYTARLVGPTDGRTSERVADYLLGTAGAPPRARVATAVVLAAGMGTRLGNASGGKPKGFLELGGRPIVEESIEKLAAAGIERVIVVTGHGREHYEALARRHPKLVELVHNERYAQTGSLDSLHAAGRMLDEDVLLLESDLVYEGRALEHLLGLQAPDAILLSGPTGAGDEVFVETREGLLVDMSKDRSRLGPEVAGELVGISKLSRGLLARLVRIAAAARRDGLALAYETDGLVAAAAEHPIACPVLADLVWAEIDDAEHLARAQRLYPMLVERDREWRAERGATAGR